MTNNEYIDSLIIENQKLIYIAIKKLNCVYKTEDEFQALYDAGLEGLIKGAKSYDESKGKPSTWLMPCIMNEIKHCFVISSAQKRTNEAGRDISLYEKPYEDNSEIEIVDIIGDPNINIEEDFEKKLEIEKLMYAIKKVLTPLEQRIISKKYGLNGYRTYKIIELAEEEKKSRSMIHYFINQSQLKLKKYLENNDKEVFMLEEKKVLEPSKQKVKATTFKKLNDYLFDQIEKLNNKDADLEKEIPKAKVIAQLSQQIINNANTCLKAVRTVKEFEIDDTETLNLLGFENVKK